MSDSLETIIVPRKKISDIYSLGKHSITLKDEKTIVEWEITAEAKKALLDFHYHKPNNEYF
jgi:hypothetical protein